MVWVSSLVRLTPGLELLVNYEWTQSDDNFRKWEVTPCQCNIRWCPKWLTDRCDMKYTSDLLAFSSGFAYLSSHVDPKSLYTITPKRSMKLTWLRDTTSPPLIGLAVVMKDWNWTPAAKEKKWAKSTLLSTMNVDVGDFYYLNLNISKFSGGSVYAKKVATTWSEGEGPKLGRLAAIIPNVSTNLLLFQPAGLVCNFPEVLGKFKSRKKGKDSQEEEEWKYLQATSHGDTLGALPVVLCTDVLIAVILQRGVRTRIPTILGPCAMSCETLQQMMETERSVALLTFMKFHPLLVTSLQKGDCYGMVATTSQRGVIVGKNKMSLFYFFFLFSLFYFSISLFYFLFSLFSFVFSLLSCGC